MATPLYDSLLLIELLTVMSRCYQCSSSALLCVTLCTFSVSEIMIMYKHQYTGLIARSLSVTSSDTVVITA